jgi:hypothetical protein
MDIPRLAKPLASLKVPIVLSRLSETLAALTNEHNEELVLRQYGSHLVIFTEGELCSCGKCREKIDEVIPSFYSIASQGMILCSLCGNKRCPHASSHEYRCTQSNAVDQSPETLSERVGER